jgi:alanine dehydrogenase
VIAVDSLEQAHMEAGDLILADSWSNVMELEDVIRGYDPNRITIFKSIGIGLEDVAVGGVVYEKALRENIGNRLYS